MMGHRFMIGRHVQDNHDQVSKERIRRDAWSILHQEVMGDQPIMDTVHLVKHRREHRQH